ncbi:MAG: hypothetical protein Q4C26_03095 [Bacteroidales bacterium]|nr:hypothetical protein [Bacteroidales bacterium]
METLITKAIVPVSPMMMLGEKEAEMLVKVIREGIGSCTVMEEVFIERLVGKMERFIEDSRNAAMDKLAGEVEDGRL